MRRGSISSELIMSGRGVCSILLLHLVASCLETNGDCVGICGNVCCVVAVVEEFLFLSFGVLKYVVCLCKGCDGCCVFCLNGDAWSCRYSCMSISSCRWCMFMSCVHPVAVLNVAFCMPCSLIMLIEDETGDHMEETYFQSRSHDCLIGNHECLFLFTPSCCGECFYHL